jgi:hypothetical protein
MKKVYVIASIPAFMLIVLGVFSWIFIALLISLAMFDSWARILIFFPVLCINVCMSVWGVIIGIKLLAEQE